MARNFSQSVLPLTILNYVYSVIVFLQRLVQTIFSMQCKLLKMRICHLLHRKTLHEFLSKTFFMSNASNTLFWTHHCGSTLWKLKPHKLMGHTLISSNKRVSARESVEKWLLLTFLFFYYVNLCSMATTILIESQTTAGINVSPTNSHTPKK